MSKKSANVTEQWLIDKGYTYVNGAWQPPVIKSKYIKQLKDEKAHTNLLALCAAKETASTLIIKQKVNNTPDFNVKPVTEWFIPYQVPSKKNTQQLYIKRTKDGRHIPGTTTSKRYKDYITATRKYWETFAFEFKSTISKLDISYPLNVEFTFIRATNQEVDYVGPLESVQDIMQDFGWIPNDNYKHLRPHLGYMEVNKNNPGVRIKLLTQ